LWFCTIFLLLGGFFILLFLEFYTVLFAGHDHAAILSLASVTRAARSVVLLDSVESGVARDFVAAVLAADGGLLFNGFSGDHVGTAGGGIIPFFVMDLSVSFLIACACTVCIFFMLLLVKPGIFTLFAYLYLGLLVVLSLVFITCHSLFTMFITFECLLLTSLGLLKLTSKSERIGEAISEMFMWTLFGSFFLLLGFFSAYTEAGDSLWHINSARGFLTSTLSNFTCVLFLIGFGVKIPT
jgi:formate hydrogenlyase subunit 3/multisubunit Na+/H+ antiporter MnhD subunit